MNKLKNVIGIGNPVVDVLFQTNESFLEEYELIKGSMKLVDSHQARLIYSKMSDTAEISGGSVANTMVGIASLGGTCSYIGKVHDDELGRTFKSDMSDIGIKFETVPSQNGSSTGQCLVMITPDGQRTMATYLGACSEIGPEDINPDTIRNHEITYLEGYLWDTLNAKEAMLKASGFSKEFGRRVALTLSDTFCVQRHRDSFRYLIAEYVDILFANEEEIMSLYEEDSLYRSIDYAQSETGITAITLGNRGSVIASQGVQYNISAAISGEIIDTTGAGDLYAAGFLFGITNGYDIKSSGWIGSMSAGEIITQVGARSNKVLKDLLNKPF